MKQSYLASKTNLSLLSLKLCLLYFRAKAKVHFHISFLIKWCLNIIMCMCMNCGFILICVLNMYDYSLMNCISFQICGVSLPCYIKKLHSPSMQVSLCLIPLFLGTQSAFSHVFTTRWASGVLSDLTNMRPSNQHFFKFKR